MKKLLTSLILVFVAIMGVAYADIDVYGDVPSSSGDAVIGDRGFVHIDNGANSVPEVALCAPKDGDMSVAYYHMNLQSEGQMAKAMELLLKLANRSFAVFDHFGCLRERIV